MKIKIKCVCGSVYSFEETPVLGRVQFPVSCVNCGADGTEQANAYIDSKLRGTPTPIEAADGGRFFRWKKKKEIADLDETVPPRSLSGDLSEDARSASRLILAAVGALAVGVAGAVGWLYLAKATGFEFGYVAWGLGALVGVTARVLGPRGHSHLGVIGAIAALVAIGGGELLTGRWVIQEYAKEFLSSAGEEASEFARSAASALPEDDLSAAVARYRLAKVTAGEDPAGPLATYQRFQLAESEFVIGHIIERDRPMVLFAKQNEAANPQKVSAQESAEFEKSVLPVLQRFAAGNPSQADYESQLREMLMKRVNLKSFLIASMGPLSWVWIILGICTAFKVARN